MREYSIWFKYKKKLYMLPVNPEEIETTSTMAIEKYEVLKLGQIAVPANMELKEYSFEVELPGQVYPYVDIAEDKFKAASYYLDKFEEWRKKLIPVKFVAARSIDGNINLEDSINTSVLIEELTITEKAGEEGDKYAKFKLLEYADCNAKSAKEIAKVTYLSGAKYKKKKIVATSKVSKKSTGYHIVRSGESLWTIAKKYYGNGAKANIIYNANKSIIKNPGLLKTGWKLKIPDEDEFNKYSAALPTTRKKMAISSYTPSYEEAVAGFGAVLKDAGYKKKTVPSGYNASGYYGGTSAGGNTHSTSSGSF